MDFAITEHLPEGFNDKSRVWIYQSSRLFFVSEALELEGILEDFVNTWNAHGVPVKGFANLFFGRFVVFIADETTGIVSGCSTDSSVRVIKEIEKKFKVNMFDRQLLSFFINGKIEQLPISQLEYAFQQGFVTSESLYFNNTVLNKKELVEKWIIPVADSWLKTNLEKATLK